MPLAARDGCTQVAIRRGHDHDARIDRDRALPANAATLAFLQRSQQLCLDLRCRLSDLVQEDRAAAGDLREPGLVAHRAGERAPDVPKQLRLQQRFRQGHAVDADEWRCGTGFYSGGS